MRTTWSAVSVLALGVMIGPAIAGVTTMVPTGGALGSATTSGDGRFVAFASIASTLVSGDTNGTWDVFAYDRDTATTTRMSVASDAAQGNGVSEMPAISA